MTEHTVEEGTAIAEKIKVTSNVHLMNDAEKAAVAAGINGQSADAIVTKLENDPAALADLNKLVDEKTYKRFAGAGSTLSFEPDSDGQVIIVDLSATTSFTFVNIATSFTDGREYLIIAKQDGVGGHALNCLSNMVTDSAEYTANGTDLALAKGSGEATLCKMIALDGKMMITEVKAMNVRKESGGGHANWPNNP